MNQVSATNLKRELKSLSHYERAVHSARFFKTGKGEYGEGDRFLGLTVPEVRKICSKYQNLSLLEVEKVLRSPIHEDRLSAAMILVNQYGSGTIIDKENIFNFYIKNSERFNNWDLVDISSPKIVGDYLLKRDRKIIYDFASSDSLWKKRIAVVSALAFIKSGESKDIFLISKLLFKDSHDLIHKAIGWMLREVGKNIGENKLKDFLEKYKNQMSRTTLRYAIERFSERDRKHFLDKNN